MARAKPTKKTGEQPWYHEGLAFQCTGCGDCCSGEPGFVWVDAVEIAELAEFMQMDISEFEDKFVRRVGTRYSLIEYPDGDCIFLDPKTRKCTVYTARPIQCRTWPFWDSNLATRDDWDETAKDCKGCNRGTLVEFSQIEFQRSQKSV